MTEEQRSEDYPTKEEVERFISWIEDEMNNPDIPVGYCSWPDCPICRDRDLLPEQRKDTNDTAS